MGYRRPYILGGQLLTFLFFIVIALVTPKPGTGWAVYLTASFFRGVGMATVSVAVEGLACDANIPERMGLVQNVMAFGRLIGLFTANLLGGWLADKYGLTVLCIYLAVCVFPLVALPLVMLGKVVEEREAGRKDSPTFEWRAFSVLLTRDTLGLLLFALANNVSIAIGGTIGTIFLTEERGLSLEAIGQLGTIVGVFTFPGALITGIIMDRFDLRWPIALGTLINCVTSLVNIWTPRGKGDAFGFQVAMGIVGGVGQGMIYVVTVGLAMRSAPRGISASYVSIILGISNASGIIGGLWGAEIINNSTTCFVTAAIVAAAGLLSLLFFTPLSYRPIPAAAADNAGKGEGEGGEGEKGGDGEVGLLGDSGSSSGSKVGSGGGGKEGSDVVEWEVSPLVQASSSSGSGSNSSSSSRAKEWGEVRGKVV